MLRRRTDPPAGHGDGRCVPWAEYEAVLGKLKGTMAIVRGNREEIGRLVARVEELEARRAAVQAGWERATEPARRVRIAAVQSAAPAVARASTDDLEGWVSAVLDAAQPLAEWMASGRRPPTEAELAELRERFAAAARDTRMRVLPVDGPWQVWPCGRCLGAPLFDSQSELVEHVRMAHASESPGATEAAGHEKGSTVDDTTSGPEVQR